jgi:hypothetical protein
MEQMTCFKAKKTRIYFVLQLVAFAASTTFLGRELESFRIRLATTTAPRNAVSSLGRRHLIDEHRRAARSWRRAVSESIQTAKDGKKEFTASEVGMSSQVSSPQPIGM